VKIFTSELSACRKKKFLYGVVIGVLLFILLVVVPIAWIFHSPNPKTVQDYIYEYIMNRENYTYQTYKQAFYGKYQYIYPLYDQINKPIYNEIENNQQIQSFNVFKIKYNPQQRVWLASGILARCINPIIGQQNNNGYQCTIKEKTYKIEIMNGKLVVLNSRNG
jgi:hypothetical protein